MSLKLFDLNGKIALVTGGTQGLGMAMAKGKRMKKKSTNFR